MSQNDQPQSKQRSTSEKGTNPMPKKHRGKCTTIAIVVVAVVAVAGIGLWNWHNQPTFCNAACHMPMDGYVQSYEVPTNGVSTDKWGNVVSNPNAMMAYVHGQNGYTCLDCHTPTVQQQIGEVQAHVSGSYDFPLEEQSIKALLKDSSQTGDSESYCLQSGCHDITRQDLTNLTADMGIYNPHSWQHGEIDCDECHKSHRASVYQCTQCHEDAESELPDGWVDYTESQRMKVDAIHRR